MMQPLVFWVSQHCGFMLLVSLSHVPSVGFFALGVQLKQIAGKQKLTLHYRRVVLLAQVTLPACAKLHTTRGKQQHMSGHRQKVG